MPLDELSSSLSRATSHELSSSLTRVTSHDGSGFPDVSHGHSSESYAVAMQDLDSGYAREKDSKAKRKKRKPGSICQTVCARKLEILVVILLAGILASEVRRFSQGVHAPARRTHEELSMNGTSHLLDDEKFSNLDNMDMTYRKGIACLKLLPEDVLMRLKMPHLNTPSPVKRLDYVVRRENGNGRSLDEHPLDTAFSGSQTLEERTASYKVRPVMTVHCGFCGGEDDFYIDPRDKLYLAGCQIAVSTCTFGGGDDLYQPIGMTETSLSKVCYVAFWDQVTLDAQALKGQQPDAETHRIGLWRIVVVQNLPFSDQRRNGKIPKLLGHRLFPRARYSIWVDSKSQFRRDPIGVIEALLLRPKSTFAISEHGGRSCIYREGEAIVKKNKATPEEVAIQLYQYHSEGFPETAQFDGHKALAEASVIVREHNPVTNLFMCNWFNEVMRFTARDQLSFPYVLLNLKAMHPNMFNVCTRRALVNSIGHTGSKPKALTAKRLT